MVSRGLVYFGKHDDFKNDGEKEAALERGVAAVEKVLDVTVGTPLRPVCGARIEWQSDEALQRLGEVLNGLEPKGFIDTATRSRASSPRAVPPLFQLQTPGA